MAITRVNVGTRAKVASGNMTPGEPASVQSGDILVCFCMQKDNVASTMSGDWTQIFGVNNGTTSRASAWWCRRGSSAPSYTITRTGGDSGIAFVVAYRGCVSVGSPVEAYNTANSSNSQTVTAPSVSVSVANCKIIFTAHAADNGTNGVFSGTNPSPSEYVDDNTNQGSDSGLASDDGDKTDIGATGDRTSTYSLAQYHVGSTIALKQPMTQETSKTSAARIKKTQSTTKLSSARIRRTQETGKTSGARVRKTQEAQKTSAARVRATQEITKLSSTRVRATGQIQKTSATRVRRTFTVTKTSDARIATGVTTYTITKYSNTRVRKTQSTSKTSLVRIRVTKDLSKTSTTRIRRTQALSKTSTSRIRQTRTISKLSTSRVRQTQGLSRTSIARVIRVFTITKTSNARISGVGGTKIITKTSIARISGHEWGTLGLVDALAEVQVEEDSPTVHVTDDSPTVEIEVEP